MKSIQLRTEIPGPKSRALVARRDAAIPRGPALVTPIFAARSEGAVIEDVDGNHYLDFAGGIGCLNTGHRAPRVQQAVREQLDKFLHLCFGVTPYESYVALAEKLNALAPISGPKKTMFVSLFSSRLPRATASLIATLSKPLLKAPIIGDGPPPTSASSSSDSPSNSSIASSSDPLLPPARPQLRHSSGIGLPVHFSSKFGRIFHLLDFAERGTVSNSLAYSVSCMVHVIVC